MILALAFRVHSRPGAIQWLSVQGKNLGIEQPSANNLLLVFSLNLGTPFTALSDLHRSLKCFVEESCHDDVTIPKVNVAAHNVQKELSEASLI
jgi:hypothetical protein